MSAELATDEELTVRAHDIVVRMECSRLCEFETLATLGVAVKLALHLRGRPLHVDRAFSCHP
jgi:hypothetical protein